MPREIILCVLSPADLAELADLAQIFLLQLALMQIFLLPSALADGNKTNMTFHSFSPVICSLKTRKNMNEITYDCNHKWVVIGRLLLYLKLITINHYAKDHKICFRSIRTICFFFL